MEGDRIKNRLKTFKDEHNAVTKGPLSLLVQLTRIVRSKPFPLDPGEFLTENKGQVAGLGGGNLKKVLKEHGITQTLAAEGGRTSRGNLGLMIAYVGFLNAWRTEESIDFDAIEEYWAEQVREYFRNQPFVLTTDPSKTVAAALDGLFEQARKRQRQNPGTQYLGAVLQHLVGAKLFLILPQDQFAIYGVSVADLPAERGGDFRIGDTILHCTTAPGAPLIEKCSDNIEFGYAPVIITVFERVKTALDLAADAGLSGRLEVWDIRQFLSTNINEHGRFDAASKSEMLSNIIEKYNEIIAEVETDPSLRIAFKRK
ncbi:MAG: DUF4928 family protein [Clostridiales Family XIII bacterium]|jgi:hypothetical protein|nr:DUF4928 family protein [Clostridiales Family XIII bacterium]